MRATPYVLSDVERERSRNKEQKRKKRSVSKNEETKAGRARHQRRRKALAGAAEQEQEWIRSWRWRMSPFVSLWIHAFSTDLRVVSMTCDLLAEQRKRDRGKKNYERREEQRIRSETWVDHYARGALIEIEAACISLFRFALPPTAVPPFSEL